MFFADWSCGAHQTAPTGLIQSPNYPDYHPPCTECLWTIPVPHSKCTVSLNFTFFLMEGTGNEYYDPEYEDCNMYPYSYDDEHCDFDYVAISDISGTSKK